MKRGGVAVGRRAWLSEEGEKEKEAEEDEDENKKEEEEEIKKNPTF